MRAARAAAERRRGGRRPTLELREAARRLEQQEAANAMWRGTSRGSDALVGNADATSPRGVVAPRRPHPQLDGSRAAGPRRSPRVSHSSVRSGGSAAAPPSEVREILGESRQSAATRLNMLFSSSESDGESTARRGSVAGSVASSVASQRRRRRKPRNGARRSQARRSRGAMGSRDSTSRRSTGGSQYGAHGSRRGSAVSGHGRLRNSSRASSRAASPLSPPDKLSAPSAPAWAAGALGSGDAVRRAARERSRGGFNAARGGSAARGLASGRRSPAALPALSKPRVAATGSRSRRGSTSSTSSAGAAPAAPESSTVAGAAGSKWGFGRRLVGQMQAKSLAQSIKAAAAGALPPVTAEAGNDGGRAGWVHGSDSIDEGDSGVNPQRADVKLSSIFDVVRHVAPTTTPSLSTPGLSKLEKFRRAVKIVQAKQRAEARELFLTSKQKEAQPQAPATMAGESALWRGASRAPPREPVVKRPTDADRAASQAMMDAFLAAGQTAPTIPRPTPAASRPGRGPGTRTDPRHRELDAGSDAGEASRREAGDGGSTTSRSGRRRVRSSTGRRQRRLGRHVAAKPGARSLPASPTQFRSRSRERDEGAFPAKQRHAAERDDSGAHLRDGPEGSPPATKAEPAIPGEPSRGADEASVSLDSHGRSTVGDKEAEPVAPLQDVEARLQRRHSRRMLTAAIRQSSFKSTAMASVAETTASGRPKSEVHVPSVSRAESATETEAGDITKIAWFFQDAAEFSGVQSAESQQYSTLRAARAALDRLLAKFGSLGPAAELAAPAMLEAKDAVELAEQIHAEGATSSYNRAGRFVLAAMEADRAVERAEEAMRRISHAEGQVEEPVSNDLTEHEQAYAHAVSDLDRLEHEVDVMRESLGSGQVTDGFVATLRSCDDAISAASVQREAIGHSDDVDAAAATFVERVKRLNTLVSRARSLAGTEGTDRTDDVGSHVDSLTFDVSAVGDADQTPHSVAERLVSAAIRHATKRVVDRRQRESPDRRSPAHIRSAKAAAAHSRQTVVGIGDPAKSRRSSVGLRGSGRLPAAGAARPPRRGSSLSTSRRGSLAQQLAGIAGARAAATAGSHVAPPMIGNTRFQASTRSILSVVSHASRASRATSVLSHTFRASPQLMAAEATLTSVGTKLEEARDSILESGATDMQLAMLARATMLLVKAQAQLAEVQGSDTTRDVQPFLLAVDELRTAVNDVVATDAKGAPETPRGQSTAEADGVTDTPTSPTAITTSATALVQARNTLRVLAAEEPDDEALMEEAGSRRIRLQGVFRARHAAAESAVVAAEMLHSVAMSCPDSSDAAEQFSAYTTNVVKLVESASTALRDLSECPIDARDDEEDPGEASFDISVARSQIRRLSRSGSRTTLQKGGSARSVLTSTTIASAATISTALKDQLALEAVLADIAPIETRLQAVVAADADLQRTFSQDKEDYEHIPAVVGAIQLTRQTVGQARKLNSAVIDAINSPVGKSKLTPAFVEQFSAAVSAAEMVVQETERTIKKFSAMAMFMRSGGAINDDEDSDDAAEEVRPRARRRSIVDILPQDKIAALGLPTDQEISTAGTVASTNARLNMARKQLESTQSVVDKHYSNLAVLHCLLIHDELFIARRALTAATQARRAVLQQASPGSEEDQDAVSTFVLRTATAESGLAQLTELISLARLERPRGAQPWSGAVDSLYTSATAAACVDFDPFGASYTIAAPKVYRLPPLVDALCLVGTPVLQFSKSALQRRQALTHATCKLAAAGALHGQLIEQVWDYDMSALPERVGVPLRDALMRANAALRYSKDSLPAPQRRALGDVPDSIVCVLERRVRKAEMAVAQLRSAVAVGRREMSRLSGEERVELERVKSRMSMASKRKSRVSMGSQRRSARSSVASSAASSDGPRSTAALSADEPPTPLQATRVRMLKDIGRSGTSPAVMRDFLRRTNSMIWSDDSGDENADSLGAAGQVARTFTFARIPELRQRRPRSQTAEHLAVGPRSARSSNASHRSGAARASAIRRVKSMPTTGRQPARSARKTAAREARTLWDEWDEFIAPPEQVPRVDPESFRRSMRSNGGPPGELGATARRSMSGDQAATATPARSRRTSAASEGTDLLVASSLQGWQIDDVLHNVEATRVDDGDQQFSDDDTSYAGSSSRRSRLRPHSSARSASRTGTDAQDSDLVHRSISMQSMRAESVMSTASMATDASGATDATFASSGSTMSMLDLRRGLDAGAPRRDPRRSTATDISSGSYESAATASTVSLLDFRPTRPSAAPNRPRTGRSHHSKAGRGTPAASTSRQSPRTSVHSTGSQGAHDWQARARYPAPSAGHRKHLFRPHQGGHENVLGSTSAHHGHRRLRHAMTSGSGRFSAFSGSVHSIKEEDEGAESSSSESANADTVVERASSREAAARSDGIEPKKSLWRTLTAKFTAKKHRAKDMTEEDRAAAVAAAKKQRRARERRAARRARPTTPERNLKTARMRQTTADGRDLREDIRRDRHRTTRSSLRSTSRRRARDEEAYRHAQYAQAMAAAQAQAQAQAQAAMYGGGYQPWVPPKSTDHEHRHRRSHRRHRRHAER